VFGNLCFNILNILCFNINILKLLIAYKCFLWNYTIYKIIYYKVIKLLNENCMKHLKNLFVANKKLCRIMKDLYALCDGIRVDNTNNR